jgi:hypothetical protein
MRRLRRTFLILVAGAALLVPATAQAEFGLESLDVTFTNKDGTTVTQAGSHPFAVTTSEQFKTTIDPKHGEVPDESVKDLILEQIPGLVGNPNATPQCSTLDFLQQVYPIFDGISVDGRYTNCPSSTAVGHVLLSLESPEPITAAAVYNMVPPPGVAAKLGFWALTVPVTVELTVNPDPPYNIVASVTNIAQPVPFYGSELTLWGNPADPAHDTVRGNCVFAGLDVTEIKSNGTCPASLTASPFITVPRACEGPLMTSYEADSWVNPGAWVSGSVFTHDEAAPPNPAGFVGCSALGFAPSIKAEPTSKAASSPTGLDFNLDVKDEGLTNVDGIAHSDIRKAVVTLPEGMSANPSLAEGLNVCTEAQLAKETASSEPGAGCPNASKIGTVEVETPLLDESVNGSLFIAKPYENPFDSLLAMYIVIKNKNLGIVVKQAAEVIPDPVTGQLTTVADELPQLPFSHFKLHFREGARSPLTTPQACGTYDVKAELTPWSGSPPITTTSAFQVISGPNSSPCPAGGLPPFKPGLIAGTMNNRAGSFSPFNLRMFRSDSEQEITRFSIKLPPGITGKLAGIPYCPDAAIAAAKARTGPHGGQEELDNPSCPKASEIGRTLAGAGVGPSLTYAPGKVYLAGPYNGSNLSMVAITAGVVGPFDIGTVVIRQAFKIDPETAEVFIDSTGSDPIPHIIRGIPVHLRDIRAYVDRPDFVLNPTDCSATSTASTVLGSGLDFVSDADNNPVTVTSRFQAADCAALPFAPQLSFRLIGGTKRGAHPAFKAHLQMNGIGEAGIATAQVTLPKSEFIENAHFDTICTRVQFKAGAGNGAQCPPGSVYGRARAITPILAEPLEGPVFLRSSEHQLPDLVIALHNSQVDFNLVGRVDSVDGKLRNTFETAPDAPVSSFDIELAGGKKGLFVNSTNLCAKKRYATAAFTGQNGKAYTSKPELKVKCKKPKKPKGKKGKAKRHKRAALHRMRAAG